MTTSGDTSEQIPNTSLIAAKIAVPLPVVDGPLAYCIAGEGVKDSGEDGGRRSRVPDDTKYNKIPINSGSNTDSNTSSSNDTPSPPASTNITRTEPLVVSLPPPPPLASTPTPSQFHFLLLLSDSALPLGSFAFSSGLESYVAHHQYYHSRPPPPSPSPSPPRTNTLKPPTPKELILRFIPLTLTSLASTTLPYVISAWENCTSSDSDKPNLVYLDDHYDASTTCPVARRASTFQGKALLSVFEKSLSRGIIINSSSSSNSNSINNSINNSISSSTKSSSISSSSNSSNSNNSSSKSAAPHLTNLQHYKHCIRTSHCSGHFGITWGAICRYLGLSLSETCYIFLLNHLKTVLSAAVRQSLVGPYVSQGILASPESLGQIRGALELGMSLGIEEVGQAVPTVDLYQGRHELLYSRVFNS